MQPISISLVLDELFTLKTLEFLVVVTVFGMIGGLARKFAAEQSGSQKSSLLASVVIGGAAAIAILFILIPDDPIRLVSMCLIAGYGGKAVLDSVQAKMNIAKLVEEKAQIEKSVAAVIENFNDKILPILSDKANVQEIVGKSGLRQDFSDEIMKFSGILNSLEIKIQPKE